MTDPANETFGGAGGGHPVFGYQSRRCHADRKRVALETLKLTVSYNSAR
jgi:hypothetical protein